MQLQKKILYAREMDWEEYFLPESLDEALDILDRYQGSARIMAGGTDIVPASRKKEIDIKAIVDITKIEGLNIISLEGDTLKIGPLVTHAQVANSPLVQEKAMALAEGASRVGSPQVRNIGTVAGNIINAQPGADTVIPLVALGASIEVKSKAGHRIIDLNDLFLDVGKTKIDSTKEIVTAIYVPIQRENEASAAVRLAKRKALTLPILTVAVKITVDNTKKIFKGVSIAAGPVATTPFRCTSAERLLFNNEINDELILKAAKEAAVEARPRTSLIRGSSEYRKAMMSVLVERAIKLALKRLEAKNG
ncbi:MAG TPA: xanthine dehydrogenase family protein subunit M [Syntrophorhabdaceae bacterium]|nr:xanthine dehydrogenase family protein subunit M [Syntrophorhabdaceae bacterium]